MPTDAQHMKKYKDNKSLLNSSEMNIETTKYHDWVVTVAFYSAVHIIEGEIFKNATILGNHTENHEQRSQIVASHDRFKNIRAQYNQLKTRCWVARYDAHSTKKKQAKKMLEYLEHIENELLDNKK